MHEPEEGEFSEATERLFSTGHRVGEVARTFFPGGVLIDTGRDLQAAIDKTRELLARPGDVTLFEPAFEHQGVLARADVLVRKRGRLRLVEVKAAGSVKDHYLQDVAIQYWVLRGAGYEPGTVLLEHIDTSFVYPGKGDYRGLFKLENLTREAKKLQDHVPKWIRSFRRMLGGDMPSIEIGNHCHKPHDCPFIGFCTPQDGPEYPISILPYGGRVVEQLREDGFEDLRDVPEDRLTRENHLRVWRITRSGQFEIDPDVAAAIAELAPAGGWQEESGFAFTAGQSLIGAKGVSILFENRHGNGRRRRRKSPRSAAGRRRDHRRHPAGRPIDRPRSFVR